MKNNSDSPERAHDTEAYSNPPAAANLPQASQVTRPSVSVCICTYQRPDRLRQTLDSVQANLKHVGDVEVIVVDNDPNASAAEVTAKFRLSGTIDIKYHHEKTRGISSARNKAVKEAKGEWLAFIDDDELAVEHWLQRLLTAARQHDADVVFGPVIPLYEKQTPAWIITGGYFDRKRLKTGTRVGWHHARTGNALVKRAALPTLDKPFSESFGLTGGEDSFFFRGLESIGSTMIWCDEAIVYEHVPLIRSTQKWLLARSFRLGQTWARVELEYCSGRKLAESIRIFSTSALRLIITLPLILLTAPFPPTKTFNHVRTVANRAGKISALFGHRYHEY